MRSKQIKFLLLLALGPGAFIYPHKSLAADELVTLKCSDRPETIQVLTLNDLKGKTYLPLAELAKFYGIQLDFDQQTRRVRLTKGKSKAKLTLSQPIFLALDPDESFPMDPAVMVSGQLGVTPESAEVILRAVLNTNIRFLPDEKILTAGDVTGEELKREILAASREIKKPLPASAETSSRPVSVSPAQPLTISPEGDSAAEESPQEGETTQEKTDQVEKLPRPGKVEVQVPSSSKIYRVQRIVIDAGHGGYDSGAKGYDGRFAEKDATMDIARRVVDILKPHPGLEVMLTRKGDYYVTLKDRTEFANRHKADLFVSIHCNSNPRAGANGTEFYVYSAKASNQRAAVAAIRENGRIDYLNITMDALHHNAFKRMSSRLAEMMDKLFSQRLGQHMRQIQQAPFYVLAKVDMPSILIETAFISNREEEKKLKSEEWREGTAEAIADGILDFRNRVEATLENHEARR